MMKDITIETIQQKWMKAGKIDIVREASNLFIDITLKCMFGTDFKDQMITLVIDGEKKEVPLGESILLQMECAVKRVFQIHLILAEELLPFYFSKVDRELT